MDATCLQNDILKAIKPKMHQNFGCVYPAWAEIKIAIIPFPIVWALTCIQQCLFRKKNSQLYHVYHSLFKLINNSSSFDKENYDPDSVCKSVLN